MLTLFHSPMSRSSTIAALVDAMDLLDAVHIKLVSIPRQDGSGGIDADNPHPEGKVPILEHNRRFIWERTAIIIYLSDLFPDAACICPVGHEERGSFLSWLAWYGGVVEPVLVCKAAGLNHEYLTATFRGFDEMAERFVAALEDGRPYLLECGYTAVDALLHSPFALFPDFAPQDPKVRAWVKRCATHPSQDRIEQSDKLDIAHVI